MGKATVYSHLGDGKYSVLYTPEVGEVDTRIAELEALKTALDAQLYSTNGLVEGRTAADEVYNNATADFDAALNSWAACAMMVPPCPEQAALVQTVSQRGVARAEAGGALTTIKSAIAENRAQYYSATQEIAFLTNTKNGSGGGLMDVWCIDYDSDNIIPTSTVVGTLETYGAKGGYAGGYLPRKWVNIQTSEDPEYIESRDHCVKPLSGIKTAAMFFNWCQWLYVMENNPQHAVGVVLSKFDPDQNYLDVELFGSTPGAFQPGGYPFNGDSSVMLLNVPVDYLSCGADVFEEGDDVIVKFDGINRANPVVIGFAESPRECIACQHGLVVNGQLFIGGVYDRDYPQPVGGHTMLLDTPGDQVVAGRTVFTVSGSEFQICANNPPGWIYNAPNGDRWSCALGSFWHTSTTMSATLTLRRYKSTSAATPSSITQTLNITWAEGNVVNAKNMRFLDAVSDGSKALLKLTENSTDYADALNNIFEITIALVDYLPVASIAEYLTKSQHIVIGGSGLSALELRRIYFPEIPDTYLAHQYYATFWSGGIYYGTPPYIMNSTETMAGGGDSSESLTFSAWYNDAGVIQRLWVAHNYITVTSTINDVSLSFEHGLNYLNYSKVDYSYDYAEVGLTVSVNDTQIDQLSKRIIHRQTEVHPVSRSITFSPDTDVSDTTGDAETDTYTTSGSWCPECTSFEDHWLAINAAWQGGGGFAPYGSFVDDSTVYRFRLEQFDTHVFGWSAWPDAGSTTQTCSWVITPEGAYNIAAEYKFATYAIYGYQPRVTYDRFSHEFTHMNGSFDGSTWIPALAVCYV